MKRFYIIGALVGTLLLLAGLGWLLEPAGSSTSNKTAAVTTDGELGQAGSAGGNGTVTSANRSTVPTPSARDSSGTAVAADSVTGSTQTRPVSLIGGQAVEYPGSFASASVQVGGSNYKLTPNQLGNFQQVNVGPKQKVHVQVSYPQGSEGDHVAVTVEDGGHLNEKEMSEVASLDTDHNVNFQFQTTDQAGIYRVALRSGADVKVLNFWVGNN